MTLVLLTAGWCFECRTSSVSSASNSAALAAHSGGTWRFRGRPWETLLLEPSGSVDCYNSEEMNQFNRKHKIRALQEIPTCVAGLARVVWGERWAASLAALAVAARFVAIRSRRSLSCSSSTLRASKRMRFCWRTRACRCSLSSIEVRILETSLGRCSSRTSPRSIFRGSEEILSLLLEEIGELREIGADSMLSLLSSSRRRCWMRRWSVGFWVRRQSEGVIIVLWRLWRLETGAGWILLILVSMLPGVWCLKCCIVWDG